MSISSVCNNQPRLFASTAALALVAASFGQAFTKASDLLVHSLRAEAEVQNKILTPTVKFNRLTPRERAIVKAVSEEQNNLCRDITSLNEDTSDPVVLKSFIDRMKANWERIGSYNPALIKSGFSIPQYHTLFFESLPDDLIKRGIYFSPTTEFAFKKDGRKDSLVVGSVAVSAQEYSYVKLVDIQRPKGSVDFPQVHAVFVSKNKKETAGFLTVGDRLLYKLEAVVKFGVVLMDEEYHDPVSQFSMEPFDPKGYLEGQDEIRAQVKSVISNKSPDIAAVQQLMERLYVRLKFGPDKSRYKPEDTFTAVLLHECGHINHCVLDPFDYRSAISTIEKPDQFNIVFANKAVEDEMYADFYLLRQAENNSVPNSFVLFGLARNVTAGIQNGEIRLQPHDRKSKYVLEAVLLLHELAAETIKDPEKYGLILPSGLSEDQRIAAALLQLDRVASKPELFQEALKNVIDLVKSKPLSPYKLNVVDSLTDFNKTAAVSVLFGAAAAFFYFSRRQRSKG